MKLLTIVYNSVAIGSFQHVFPIIFAIVFTIGFVRYSNSKFNDIQKQKAIHYLAYFVSITLIGFHLYRMLFDNYNFKTDLPFYLCSLMALLIPIFTHYRKYWMFEVLIFWIVGTFVS